MIERGNEEPLLFLFERLRNKYSYEKGHCNNAIFIKRKPWIIYVSKIICNCFKQCACLFTRKSVCWKYIQIQGIRKRWWSHKFKRKSMKIKTIPKKVYVAKVFHMQANKWISSYVEEAIIAQWTIVWNQYEINKSSILNCKYYIQRWFILQYIADSRYYNWVLNSTYYFWLPLDATGFYRLRLTFTDYDWHLTTSFGFGKMRPTKTSRSQQKSDEAIRSQYMF